VRRGSPEQSQPAENRNAATRLAVFSGSRLLPGHGAPLKGISHAAAAPGRFHENPAPKKATSKKKGQKMRTENKSVALAGRAPFASFENPHQKMPPSISDLISDPRTDSDDVDALAQRCADAAENHAWHVAEHNRPQSGQKAETMNENKTAQNAETAAPKTDAGPDYYAKLIQSRPADAAAILATLIRRRDFALRRLARMAEAGEDFRASLKEVFSEVFKKAPARRAAA